MCRCAPPLAAPVVSRAREARDATLTGLNPPVVKAWTFQSGGPKAVEGRIATFGGPRVVSPG